MATGPSSTAAAPGFFDMDGQEIQREIKLTRQTGAAIGKGNFRHFMEKELHEHPAAIADTLPPDGQPLDLAPSHCRTCRSTLPPSPASA